MEPKGPSQKVSGPRLWEPTHPEGKVVLMMSQRYTALINQYRPAVCKVIRVSELWNTLRQLGVVTKTIIDDLQVRIVGENQTRRNELDYNIAVISVQHMFSLRLQ